MGGKATVTFILSAVLFVSCGSPPSTPPSRPAGPPIWEDVVRARPTSASGLTANGREAYEAQCAACHGIRGDGRGPASHFLATAPRDFTKGVFRFRTTVGDGMPQDEDLFRSVTVGFPAYGMPSFSYLRDEERWALIDYVKTFYPKWDAFGVGETLAIGAEPPRTVGWEERGRRLYETKFDCKKCHGPTGRGDGPSAKDLKDEHGRPIRPRDYSLGPVFRKSGWRPRDTVRVMATGLPGTPMTGYFEQLADPADLTEFWEAAWYVERLAQASRK